MLRFALTLAFLSLSAPGAQIVKLSEKLPGMSISLGPGEPLPQLNERVCLQRPGHPGWCGTIVGVSSAGAIVKLASVPVEWPVPKEAVKMISVAPPPVVPTPLATPTPKPKPVIESKTDRPTAMRQVAPTRPAKTEDTTSPGPSEMRRQDSPHHFSTNKPKFRVLFDFVFVNRPGVTPAITFDTYHNLLWIEYLPSEKVKFSAEVSQNPRFFEIGYQILPKMQLRIGRIWIPFDDLGPHTLYGGRANVAKMGQPTGSSFLPDFWTDLGAAIRYDLFKNPWVSLVGHLYVVNGFGEGGNDPKGQTDSYPDFSQIPMTDNNYDKGFGARLEMKVGRFFGAGASVYRARYSNQAKANGEIFMFGADAQLQVTSLTELRFGYAYMDVSLFGAADPAALKRGGLYAELGQKIGKFKLLARAGQSQNDSRVLDVTDQSILGGVLMYRAGPVQLSVELSHDVNTLPGKTYYTFMGARIVSFF